MYVCVYCGKEVPDGCDHPNLFQCCGEVGHVELSEGVVAERVTTEAEAQ